VDFSSVADKSYNYILMDKSTEFSYMYRKLAEEAIIDEMIHIIQVTVKFGGDLFNLEDKLRHHDYKSWIKVEENWHEVLKTAQFIFHAEVNIQN
jgi:hypothetical protein